MTTCARWCFGYGSVLPWSSLREHVYVLILAKCLEALLQVPVGSGAAHLFAIPQAGWAGPLQPRIPGFLRLAPRLLLSTTKLPMDAGSCVS
jgi:hypothetical protein